MRKFIFFASIFFILSISGSAQSGEEKELLEAVEALNNALVSPDEKRLIHLTDRQLSYGHSSGKVQNQLEFVQDLLHGPFDFLTVSVANQSIKIAYNNAVVRHTFSSNFINSGVPGDLKIEILQVWQKRKGKWRLLARQAYKI